MAPELLALSLLITLARAIPMTHSSSCSQGNLIRLTNGDSLHLDCESQCSATAGEAGYHWTKTVQGGRAGAVPLDQGPSLSVSSVSFSDGGQYVCRCLPGGEACTYNVTILPEMTFESSDNYVHYGESFDLTCTVRGFPSNHSTIKTKYGVELPKQIRRQVDAHTSRSFVALMEAEEGEFVCTAETYYQGKPVGVLEKSVSVKVYEPPVIIYTTEFIVHSVDDLGKPGQLTCAVQISPDAGTKVSWWVNGTQIEEGHTKYVTDIAGAREGDVRKYKLIINDLQLSDIGSYLCQLSSDYAVEDVQEAWIQVDYRERSKEQGHELSGEGLAAADSGTSRSRVLFYIVCGVCLATCALGAWKLTKTKLKRRKQEDTPLIGYDPSGAGHKRAVIQSDTFSNGATAALLRRK